MRQGKSSEAWELYHLSKDRSETNNLATSNHDRAVVMKEASHKWYRDTTGTTFREPIKKSKSKKEKNEGPRGK